jgi:sugar phosphate permease
MLTFLSWRAVFVIFGAIGFVWAAAWYWWFRDEPELHAAVSAEELEHIQRGRGAADSHHLDAAGWRRIFTNRSLLALCAAYFTQGYSFYFFITWLPTYLENARGFTSTTMGVMAGLPLLMNVLADLLGGITTDRLTKRFGLRIGRCGVGGVSLLLAGIWLIAGTATDHALLGVALISIALAFSNFLLGASWGTCTDIAGGRGQRLYEHCRADWRFPQSDCGGLVRGKIRQLVSAAVSVRRALFSRRAVLVVRRPATSHHV